MADLQIETCHGFSLVAVMAHRGVDAGRVGGALGIKEPVEPARHLGADGLSLIGIGAGNWLAYSSGAAKLSAAQLRTRLEGLASVSDQSSGYVILRLSGEGARTALQRGMPIDLHPDVFGPGSAATTVISHIGAIVWQVDDRPTYEVATFRSFSDSFRHWLDQAAAAL